MHSAIEHVGSAVGRSVAAIVVALTVQTASAQEMRWPDAPRNLQVLPAGTAGPRLGEYMRSFTAALGVGCSHCHAGVGTDYPNYDFASDEKQTKRTARAMLRMVRLINDSLLPAPSSDGSGVPRVACITCHRGQPKPVLLEELLFDVSTKLGSDSAVARYEELRSRYFGGFTFDFLNGPLTRLGDRLLARGDTTGAVRMLQIEVDRNGGSFGTFFSLGRALAALQRTAEAIAAFERGARLAPPPVRPAFEREISRLRPP